MRNTIAKLQAKLEDVKARVYACGESHMPLATCLSLAPYTLADEYGAVVQALSAAEDRAVAAGKAYRGSFGMLAWNRA